MSLFTKYPFPCTIPAVWDELVHRACAVAGSALAGFFLRAQSCPVGRGFDCDGLPRIRMQKPGSITLGEGVAIKCRPMSNLAGISQHTILHCIGEGRIVLGDGSGMSGVVLSSRTGIRLGKRVNLGVNVRIYDHDFHSLDPQHRTDRRTDQAHVKSAAVVLGDDVFVGANAMILKGVRIGDRSVVAAGSIVTGGDYPGDSLIAGNPAKVVKSLS